MNTNMQSGNKSPVLIALGAALVAAAAISTPHGLERLLGRPAGVLEWGPALFRALLAFHGTVAIIAGLRWKNGEGKRISWLEGTSSLGWVVVGVLTAVGLGLRLWRLDSSLWLDEVLTATYFVRPPLGEIVSSFPFQNQHLLYSIAARAMVSLFGETAAALRIPAVVLGTACIPALYLLGRKVVSESTAIAACALMTFSYHHIWFSQNARGYSGLLLFAIVTAWLWLRCINGGSRRDWTAYVLATVLGFGIHITMVFVTLAQVLIHLALPARKRGFTAYVLAGTITLQLYALALPDFLRSGMREISLPSEWTSPMWLLRATLMNFGPGMIGAAVVLVGAFVGSIGVLSIARRNRAAAAALVLPPVIAAAAVLSSGHNLWPRFFFFAMGFGLLIAMEGGMTAVRLCAEFVGRPKLAARAAVAAACLVVAGSAATVPRCYAYPKQDFTGARDYVERMRAADEPAIAVGAASLVYKNYYAPRWMAVENGAQLETLDREAASPWLVYTLPIELRTYHPDVWRVVEREYRPVKIFPGTLKGGGEVYVCRRIMPHTASAGRRQAP
jgi:mannosyltransferase